ncbi:MULTISPECIES: hypothetical protein [unclassified Mesorhizobium]|uniref:hypothetical protein n=1 Tax=unclassified Mesorhizobium TaxID=325217 RepID=UPI003014E325
MRATLQIIAAVITVAVLAAIHQGVSSLQGSFSADFAYGALFGGLFVGGLMAIAMCWDHKSAANTTGGREQQRSRNTIDL